MLLLASMISKFGFFTLMKTTSQLKKNTGIFIHENANTKHT